MEKGIEVSVVDESLDIFPLNTVFMSAETNTEDGNVTLKMNCVPTLRRNPEEYPFSLAIVINKIVQQKEELSNDNNEEMELLEKTLLNFLLGELEMIINGSFVVIYENEFFNFEPGYLDN